MELGKVIDVTACEPELHQRVFLYENRLNSEAQSEVELAVQCHEARLGSMAAAEVQQAQHEVQAVLMQYDARQNELAQAPRAALQQSELRFMEDSHKETRQYEGYITMHCEAEQRADMQHSAQVLQRYFEPQ